MRVFFAKTSNNLSWGNNPSKNLILRIRILLDILRIECIMLKVLT